MLELVQGADKRAFFCLEFYANSFCLDWTLISGNLGEIGFEKSLFGRPGLRNLSWQPGILLDEVKGGLEVIVCVVQGRGSSHTGHCSGAELYSMLLRLFYLILKTSLEGRFLVTSGCCHR